MDYEDEQSIQAFMFTCNELKETAFGCQFKVSACKAYRLQPNSVHSTKCKKLEWELFRSFLLSFRKLALNNDIGNFNRVLNILSRLGNRADQIRIREIKHELKSVERSIAGARLGIGKNRKPVYPRAAFDALVNGQLFHNDVGRQEDLVFFKKAGIFALGAVLHYVIFTYKQALRVEGAIRLRGIA